KWRKGQELSTGSEGASFTTPVNMSGATSPAARAIAKINPVRMPGSAEGITTLSIVSNFVAPRANDPSRNSRGTADNPSSVATMTTGTVSNANVRDAHRMPPVPNVGVGSRSGKKSVSSVPPMAYMKNPNPNTPKTIEGTPARLLTAILTRRTKAPCLAYSRRYSAASTPKGTTARLMTMTIMTVPKMAGNIPPSVLASLGSLLRTDQTFVR